MAEQQQSFTPGEVQAAIAKLTKAQRGAILASQGSGLWSDGRFAFTGDRRAAAELYGELVDPAEPNGLWATYSLTPLGLAVRAALPLSRTGDA